MSKQILRDLPELVNAGVIDEVTASRIRAHYGTDDGRTSNRLVVIFAVIGALLVGLGIVLILAHNWDDLGNPVKLTIGLTPLVAGQALTAIILLKNIDTPAWREGVAVFLFCSIMVSTAIVSQVYNIAGDLSGYLLTCVGLALPIIYVLRSGAAVLLCIAGITWYACEVSYFTYLGSEGAPMYWVVMAIILPAYVIFFVREKVKSNFYVWISWLLTLSLSICLASAAENTGRLFLIAYMSMFSAFVMAGESTLLQTSRILSNAYLVVGSLGVVSILLMASFVDFWHWESTPKGTHYSAWGVAFIAGTTLAATVALITQARVKGLTALNKKSFAFLLFIAIYLIGVEAPQTGALIVNLSILVLAVYTIRSGAHQNHLGILNYGLLIIAALVLCRFFDTDLSFVVRGLLFIAVGAGFFAANYYMIKQRRAVK